MEIQINGTYSYGYHFRLLNQVLSDLKTKDYIPTRVICDYQDTILPRKLIMEIPCKHDSYNVLEILDIMETVDLNIESFNYNPIKNTYTFIFQVK